MARAWRDHGEGVAAAFGYFSREAVEVFFRRGKRDIGSVVGEVEPWSSVKMRIMLGFFPKGPLGGEG
jgi:hypothetical protein